MSTRCGNAIGRVAIVGGGLSGLMCAVKLKQLGLDAVVYDTGKHAVGGRCSSRHVEVGGRQYVVDHSVQAFTAVSERFRRVVSYWQAEGVVAEWEADSVGVLRLAPPSAPSAPPGRGRFTPRSAKEPPLFICPNQGMRGLAEYLARSVAVKRPVWVGRLVRRPAAAMAGSGSGSGSGSGPGDGGQWDLYGAGGRHLGTFDYVVIAHNGKCADQLMATAGLPALHNLLKVRFCPQPMPQQQVMQLCSLWVLMVGFSSPLPVDWQGAFVEGSPVISWAANNTAKIATNRRAQAAAGGGASGAGGGGGNRKGSGAGGSPLEIWTLISTREFGSQHKVPQENIPPDKAREVTEAMLSAFAAAVGLVLPPPQPSYSRVQLWGAAVPMNVLVTDTARGEGPCVLSSDSRVGICGDWLHSPCVEGACLSGLALAEAIQADWQGSRNGRSTGLGAPRFRVVATAGGGSEAAPIGAFASTAGSSNLPVDGSSTVDHSNDGDKSSSNGNCGANGVRSVSTGGGQFPRQGQGAKTLAQRKPPSSPQPEERPQPQFHSQPVRPASAQQGWLRSPPSTARGSRSLNPVPVLTTPTTTTTAPPPPKAIPQPPTRQQQQQHHHHRQPQ
ncbi:hypothetical protein Vafri_8937 [Volvox africanus]|uniref:Amine oxidase domain-containing protein n=1 Tax=Volvox africanus TaxID=51714 RepID=A0A8J4B443_9CHLO|nr:hypothetical protein Vafri_8937 [Volvox africanus]